MNILMIVTWFSPKNQPIISGLFHYELAVSLKKYENCDVAIYFPYDGEIKEGVSKEISEDQIRIFRTGWKKSLAERTKNYEQAFSEIRKDFPIDIIHAQCANGAGRIALQLGRKHHIPYCVSEHSPPELLRLNKIKKRILLYWVYKGSRRNTCVSDYMTRFLQLQFKDIAFETVYNGIDIPESVRDKNALSVYDRWNICICAEFYDKEIKGYQFLLPAIKKYNESHKKKVFLHICGDGKYKEAYEKLSETLDIADSVCFYGHVNKEDVYGLIEIADYCVSASLFESAGVFVEEALWFGKPMVVTNAGGSNSLVNDRCAIVVERGSIDALVYGMEVMENDYGRFSAEEISAYAKERYGMKSVCDHYYDIFQGMISQKE